MSANRLLTKSTPKRGCHRASLAICTTLITASLSCLPLTNLLQSVIPWPRHTIDASGQGADGVRPADVNRDGFTDLVAAWEESGQVKVYLNPGPNAATLPWPTATIGRVASVEDAVFVDLDDDDATDVVSSAEGNLRSIFIHWAPTDPNDYLQSAAWQTQTFPAVRDAARWMFCAPMHVDAANGIDLVIGARGDDGQIGWLESPSNPRNVDAWHYHRIADAGWVMSLIPADLDHDGDLDVIASDRRGDNRGVFWFENPNDDLLRTLPWPRHPIGGQSQNVMFADLADLDGDGLQDVIAATQGHLILFFHRTRQNPPAFQTFQILVPDSTGTGKAVRVADLDQDGKNDIVFSTENAKDKIGLARLTYTNSPFDPIWTLHDIAGTPGSKFDLIQLIDLDGDGDLDPITTEENANLGVIWYQNPLR